MPKQLSFRKQEREVQPGYRALIDKAESVEDVRKFFERTARDFLWRAVGDQIEVDREDILFSPGSQPAFRLSSRLEDDPHFNELLDTSDLNTILAEFSDRAQGRWKHLERKQPDKTESKIYPVPGGRRG